jgi:sulfite exporter TauE/SafE
VTAGAAWAFFATGLAGGVGHCLAMCGPLVASLGLTARPGQGVARAAAAQLPYHLGRVTTYGAVGAAMGLAGSFVNVAGRLAGASDAAAVLAGGTMVLLGLGAAGLVPGLKRLEAVASARLVGGVRRLAGAAGLYPLGLALGLLPCGLSWTVFLGAAATGGAVPGLLAALAFGAGTVPGLALAGALGAALGQRARGLVYRAGGLLVAVLGLLFALRGLGLVHVPL